MKRAAGASELFGRLVGRLMFWCLWPLIWIYSPLKKRSRILVVYGDQFLVVKSYFGSNKWQLPGGGMHKNEDPKAASARELFEETKIKVKLNEISELCDCVFYEHGLKMRYLVFAVNLNQKPDVVTQKLEISDYTWLPLRKNNPELANHVAAAINQKLALSDKI